VSRPPASALRAPPAVPADGHLRVVAPAGPYDAGALALGVERLRAAGYRVSVDAVLEAHRPYLAAPDALRLAALRRALEDPDVDGIVAARGGYGATRLLEALDPEEVRRADRVLVGFSDITALHALWARAGLRSLHGTMAARLHTLDEEAFGAWRAALSGAVPPPLVDLELAVDGPAVEGPLLGGNLAVLLALLGTPAFPDLDGAVLLLEDVNEPPYRLDRMLTTLRQAGVFDRVVGVLAGAFTGSALEGLPVGTLLRDAIPVTTLCGAAVGHLQDPGAVPLGGRVRVDPAHRQVRFFDPVTGPG
jgi:muramoyltetrapeptide carboxypeptidase